jgi:multidrug transporter EmrE-like cation transporter
MAAALLLRWALGAARTQRGGQAELPLAMAVGLAFGTGALLTEAWTASVAPNASALMHPLLWGLVAANVVGLVLLQAAFQRGRASVVVPVQLAVGNALAVGGGAWLFGEALTPERLFSVALILAGAALLQGRAGGPGPSEPAAAVAPPHPVRP